MQAGNKDPTVDLTVYLTVHTTRDNPKPPGNESMDNEWVIDVMVGHEHTIFGIRY